LAGSGARVTARSCTMPWRILSASGRPSISPARPHAAAVSSRTRLARGRFGPSRSAAHSDDAQAFGGSAAHAGTMNPLQARSSPPQPLGEQRRQADQVPPEGGGVRLVLLAVAPVGPLLTVRAWLPNLRGLLIDAVEQPILDAGAQPPDDGPFLGGGSRLPDQLEVGPRRLRRVLDGQHGGEEVDGVEVVVSQDDHGVPVFGEGEQVGARPRRRDDRVRGDPGPVLELVEAAVVAVLTAGTDGHAGCQPRQPGGIRLGEVRAVAP
jgi:hypothetical protein